MKLICLIENTAPDGLLCEHGLSVWIEYNDKILLLDTGSTPASPPTPTSLGWIWVGSTPPF